MNEALIVSNLLLWVVVIALALVCLALARQIGVLTERIAPAGALIIDQGPRVGTRAPLFELPDLAGRVVKLGGVNTARRSTLILWVSPTCPMCKKLLPAAKSLLAKEAAIDLVFASDGDVEAQRAFVAREKLEAHPYLLSPELGLAYQIGKLPYAVLIDADGVIRAKGLINTREHLESLIEAQARGVASLQEYLRESKA